MDDPGLAGPAGEAAAAGPGHNVPEPAGGIGFEATVLDDERAFPAIAGTPGDQRGGEEAAEGESAEPRRQAGSRPDSPSSRSKAGADSGTATRGPNALPSPW